MPYITNGFHPCLYPLFLFIFQICTFIQLLKTCVCCLNQTTRMIRIDRNTIATKGWSPERSIETKMITSTGEYWQIDHCEITMFVAVLILHEDAREQRERERWKARQIVAGQLTVISLCISIKRWALGSTFFIGLLRIWLAWNDPSINPIRSFFDFSYSMSILKGIQRFI